MVQGGIQELIETATGKVGAGRKERVVHKPETLYRFMKGAGRLCGHPAADLGHRQQIGAALGCDGLRSQRLGQIGVAVGQFDHSRGLHLHGPK